MTVRIPSYRLHKPSHRAVVTIDGRDHYLGPYGSAESRQKYGDLIARHAAGLSIDLPKAAPSDIVLVGDIVLAFMRHADTHYRKDGVRTDEYHCLKSASEPLVELYGETDAAQFGALALKAVRSRMIELGWSRRYINKSVGRIRRMFRHALSDDLIHPEVLQRLESVAPLLKGRTKAIELPRRSAVPQEHINAVRKDVKTLIKDLMDLALLTGARPGELVSLTGDMIDRKGDVWTVIFSKHKMSHLDKERVIAFGPKAQLILRKYLKADPALRLFPITRATFSNNIKASCKRLGLPKFTGHWLRHNAATEIRKESGLDGAQIVLGHSHANTTELYAHLDHMKLVEIARKRG